MNLFFHSAMLSETGERVSRSRNQPHLKLRTSTDIVGLQNSGNDEEKKKPVSRNEKRETNNYI